MTTYNETRETPELVNQRTPTQHGLKLRAADFATLSEALDYAARGDTGFNYYNSRGEIYCAQPYALLQHEARELALRLRTLGAVPGDRLALIAETGPDFIRFFFACQYARLVPVPLPAAVHLGGRQAYIAQIRAMLHSSKPVMAMAPDGFLDMLHEAAAGLPIARVGSPADFAAWEPVCSARLEPSEPGDLAYLQYTSGSTRFPRGVMIEQRSVMSNLAGILRVGLEMNSEDRCVSWLPYYHDMGLVGLVLATMASQRSGDFLGTRDFAMRPRTWLKIMTESGGTVAFSPPFGYELCTRRLRDSDIAELDLSPWRIAGAGAETIRSTTLRQFAERLAPCGFDPKAFIPCYGMAECSLAVSFAPHDASFDTDLVDADRMATNGIAVPVAAPVAEQKTSEFVDCGYPLPDLEIEIRDEAGNTLPDRHVGLIHIRGLSVMTGYFNDPESTAEVLSADGWLNTGDLGYTIDGRIIITGRQKDLIIINGRNIWPQDLEYIAERQPEVRSGDASAFAIALDDGEQAVLVVQCRQAGEAARADLAARIRADLRAESGIDCLVELVPPHTLPRTSSGKLSRSGARRDFLQRHGLGRRITQDDLSGIETATAHGQTAAV